MMVPAPVVLPEQSPVHIKSIEAAFAQSVPSFVNEDDQRSDEKPDTSLPKWRTWVNKMR